MKCIYCGKEITTGSMCEECSSKRKELGFNVSNINSPNPNPNIQSSNIHKKLYCRYCGSVLNNDGTCPNPTCQSPNERNTNTDDIINSNSNLTEEQINEEKYKKLSAYNLTCNVNKIYHDIHSAIIIGIIIVLICQFLPAPITKLSYGIVSHIPVIIVYLAVSQYILLPIVIYTIIKYYIAEIKFVRKIDKNTIASIYEKAYKENNKCFMNILVTLLYPLIFVLLVFPPTGICLIVLVVSYFIKHYILSKK